MMKLKYLFLISLSISMSCVVHDEYFVRISKDDFDKRTLYFMKGNILASDDKLEALSNKADLGILRVDKTDTTIFMLVLNYQSNDWLHIENNEESLIFLIDGKRIGLTGMTDYVDKDVLNNGLISEKVYYPIKPEFIRKILEAKEIRIKIKGRKYYIERYLTERFKNKYRRFYSEYIKKK